MRRPGREMRVTPRLFAEPPAGTGSRPVVDYRITRMILSQLEDIPDVRVELVQSLRRAMQENRYCVNEEQVAERMILRCFARPLN